MSIQYSSFLMRYREKRQRLLQKAFNMQIMFSMKIKQKLRKLGDTNTKQQIFVMQNQVTSKHKHLNRSTFSKHFHLVNCQSTIINHIKQQN